MNASWNRRLFLQATTVSAMTCAVGSRSVWGADTSDAKLFDISLAEWSLHNMLKAGKLDNLDFAKFAKEQFDISAIEYVNQFFKDKANDAKYLDSLNSRAKDVGVKNVLIMIDGEGALGDADPKQQTKAVENHYPWVTAAKTLGCHSIRVNAQSSGSYQEQQQRAADGLRRLAEFAKDHDLNVIVENHGGLSSNGAWLAEVIRTVDLPNCGTLPDFGNFKLNADEMYDRYQGVAELMPYAKAVSAKSHDFDAQGLETHTDYYKMMKIVMDAGYHGFVGIEYEGSELSEVEGVKATKRLLLEVRETLAKTAH